MIERELGMAAGLTVTLAARAALYVTHIALACATSKASHSTAGFMRVGIRSTARAGAVLEVDINHWLRGVAREHRRHEIQFVSLSNVIQIVDAATKLHIQLNGRESVNASASPSPTPSSSGC